MIASYMNAIDKLLKTQDKLSSRVEGAEWYALRVAPSCPPDKRVHMRGGKWFPGYYGLAWNDWDHRAYTVPDLVAEIDNPDSVGIDVAFTTAGWFKPVVLHLSLPGEIEEPAEADWTFYLHDTGEEFATAGAAEAWFNSDDFRDSSPWEGDNGLPLCGLVLKNSGMAVGGCQIFPIDMINRGGSYIWPTDLRPRRVWYPL